MIRNAAEKKLGALAYSHRQATRTIIAGPAARVCLAPGHCGFGRLNPGASATRAMQPPVYNVASLASRLLLDDASCVSRQTPEINKLLCGLARIAHERYRRRRAFIHDGAQARRSERPRSRSNRRIGVPIVQFDPIEAHVAIGGCCRGNNRKQFVCRTRRHSD
jgi:hypothetical protein